MHLSSFLSYSAAPSDGSRIYKCLWVWSSYISFLATISSLLVLLTTDVRAAKDTYFLLGDPPNPVPVEVTNAVRQSLVQAASFLSTEAKDLKESGLVSKLEERHQFLFDGILVLDGSIFMDQLDHCLPARERSLSDFRQGLACGFCGLSQNVIPSVYAAGIVEHKKLDQMRSDATLKEFFERSCRDRQDPVIVLVRYILMTLDIAEGVLKAKGDTGRESELLSFGSGSGQDMLRVVSALNDNYATIRGELKKWIDQDIDCPKVLGPYHWEKSNVLFGCASFFVKMSPKTPAPGIGSPASPTDPVVGEKFDKSQFDTTPVGKWDEWKTKPVETEKDFKEQYKELHDRYGLLTNAATERKNFFRWHFVLVMVILGSGGNLWNY